MGKKLYCVDTSKKVTSKQVRDAIVTCFKQAHQEILDSIDESAEWASEEEREEMRQLEIEFIVKKAFKEAEADFENPTKEGLLKAIGKLAEKASKFRKPEIIKKHYSEIKTLIAKLD